VDVSMLEFINFGYCRLEPTPHSSNFQFFKDEHKRTACGAEFNSPIHKTKIYGLQLLFV